MVTAHSVERAKERLGYNEKYAVGFMERALSRGLTATSCEAKAEKAWLSRQAGSGYYAIAYNGSCLIISPDRVCVTIYPLPQWFGKKKRYARDKKPIRNFTRYSRMWPSAEAV